MSKYVTEPVLSTACLVFFCFSYLWLTN